MKIIAFVGFANAGKSTAASALVDRGFVSMSFADALKDCLSAIFGWQRSLIEGATAESRVFRETIDDWWAKKLEIPNFTPRYAMRYFGTETMRHHFHDNIWVMTIEHRLSKSNNQAVVFGDIRHPNEISLTRRLGGTLARIKKGDDPVWFETARLANKGDIESQRMIDEVYKIHNSEMAWIGIPLDMTITNDGPIQELQDKIQKTFN